MDICTPYVYLDLDIMENNMKEMTQRLNKANIAHRPHIKAHKSVEIAKQQIEYGAIGITVATLSEAEVMVGAGIDNILIASAIIGQENFERMKQLHPQANLIATIDSIEGARGLSKVGQEADKKVRVLIEMDGGLHRGGRQAGEDLLNFALEVKELPGLEVIGVFAYMGHIYNQNALEDVKKSARVQTKILTDAADLLRDNGFNISVISGGSTSSSMFPEEIAGLTETRAGKYPFLDVNAVNSKIISVDDCALKVRSRIISNPLPGFATIDAGSKTLTTDLAGKDDGYGYVYGKENIKIVKLDEEHGYIRYNPEEYDIKVGDEIDIIPNHVCVLANLCDYIHGFRNGKPVKKIKIDARGMNY